MLEYCIILNLDSAVNRLEDWKGDVVQLRIAIDGQCSADKGQVDSRKVGQGALVDSKVSGKVLERGNRY